MSENDDIRSESSSIAEDDNNILFACSDDLDIFIDFVQNPDSCACKRNCYLLARSHINFPELIKDLRSLTINTHKQLLYSCLLSSVEPSSSIFNEHVQRSRVAYEIPLIGKVCQKYFMAFWNCGKYRIRNYLNHIKNTRSFIFPPHGNLNNKNASLSIEVYNKVSEYLRNLYDQIGEPIATRKFIRKASNGNRSKISVEREDVIYLPSHHSYQRLYDEFKEQNQDIEISLNSFKEFWKNHQEFKKMKIRNPSKDVCDECSIFKTSVASLTDEDFTEFGESLNNDHQKHIREYRYMREEYEKDIKDSRDISNPDRPIVLSFDYAQNASIPHNPQQPASFYYYSLKKAYQFGIVDEELDNHFHYIYMESEGGKGCDQVVSMVLHYLRCIQKRKSKNLIFWADNCGGQNKNSTVIQTLLELVISQEFDNVQLKFQIKGHTRNSVDKGFGYTKREYLSSEVYSLDDFADVISRAAVNSFTGSIKCTPFKIEEMSGLFKNYTEYYSSKYKKCGKVQSYQTFKCTRENLDSVFCMQSCNPDNWNVHTLIAKKKKPFTIELSNLSAEGFCLEKQVDFYQKVRPFVPHKHHSILCPKPEDENIVDVQKIKSERSKKARLKKNIS
jgi:hypothetical protein